MSFMRGRWAILMSACAMAMSACTGLGLQTPSAVQEVYQTAEGPDETAFATIGIYSAVVEEAAVVCAEETTPLLACEGLGEALRRVNPSVALAAELWGEAFFYRSVISDINADGRVAAPELIAAAAQTFGQASSHWVQLEPSVKNAIDAARGIVDAPPDIVPDRVLLPAPAEPAAPPDQE